MMSILHDKAQIARAVNATVLPLDQAPEGYQEFDSGVSKKFVLDPHGDLQDAQRAGQEEEKGLIDRAKDALPG